MSDIYRSDAVRKLRDPQQLDTAIRLTSVSSWIALLALALIIAGVVFWAFFGNLPFRVNGLGVILQADSEIFDMQAEGGGRVQQVLAKVGDKVTKDQPLVRLANPEVQQRLRAADRLLNNLKAQRDTRAAQLDKEIADRRRVTAAAVAAYQRKIDALNERIGYLEQKRKDEESDLQKGLITRDTLESTIEDLRSARQQIRTENVQISQTQADQLDFEATSSRELAEFDEQIIQAENTRDEISTQVQTEETLRSPIDGVITEVSVKVGDLVLQGARLATVARVGEGLTMLAYMPVGSGKRVATGMPALVTPSTVERDIYGSIEGSVTAVSSLPASEAELQDRLGNQQLVEQLLGGGPSIELQVDLKTDSATASGLQWSSSDGPPLTITPGTTGLVTVIVRSERPINLLVPIVQTWVLGD